MLEEMRKYQHDPEIKQEKLKKESTEICDDIKALKKTRKKIASKSSNQNQNMERLPRKTVQRL